MGAETAWDEVEWEAQCRAWGLAPHPSDPKRRPVVLTEETVLYRSVSVRELWSVCSSGRLSGGGNRFNEFDDRPFVFFGDRISPLLLWQGEDLERAAIHRVLPMYAAEDARFAREREEIAAEKARWLERYNAAQRARGAAEAPSFDDARTWAHRNLGLRAILMREKEHDAEFKRVQKMFRWNVRDAEASLRDEIAKLPFSSAVLETRPVSGGRLYRGDFGEDRETGERLSEIGFEAGRVGFADIARIHLVRDRRVFASMPFADLDDLVMDPRGYVERLAAAPEAEPEAAPLPEPPGR